MRSACTLCSANARPASQQHECNRIFQAKVAEFSLLLNLFAATWSFFSDVESGTAKLVVTVVASPGAGAAWRSFAVGSEGLFGAKENIAA